MDCSSARLLLNIQRPGELDAVEREALEQHLDACPDCAVMARLETQSDKAIASAMQAVPVPRNLRGQIMGELLRRRRPYPWPWIASAASILLALGTGGYLWLNARTLFDASSVISNVEKNKEPAKIEEWFAAQGLSTSVPRELNFQYLNTYDVQRVQGRWVPHLLFQFPGNKEYGPALAHVYVFSEETFEIGYVPERESTSDNTIEYLQRDGFLYMILHTGGSLAPFRLRDV